MIRIGILELANNLRVHVHVHVHAIFPTHLPVLLKTTRNE